jgi:DNA polymerase-1
MAESKKRFVIIDGKSVFYRGYYAMPGLKTKDGIPTGGVYGFAVMALEVLKKLKPDYVCVAWDKPKTNIRKRLEIYPEYKAGRKPAPADFYEQIPILHKLLEAFGWPLYELDDYEADDIMGTLATQAKAKNIETMLVTSDMDVLQLVNTHTQAYLLKTGLSNIEQYSPESFEAKYGIDADQFLDYKALAGDSSDNIPGVPGIGSKTAIELLKTYKDLDSIYENVDLVKATTSKKLVDGKDSAYMSKKLAQIWTDAPVKLDLKAVDGSKSKPQEIQEILKSLGFRSILTRLPEVFKVESDFVQTSNLDLNVAKPVLIDSNEQLGELDLKSAKSLVVHGRAAGGHGQDPKVLIISPNAKAVYVIKLDKVSHAKLADKIGPLMSSTEVGKVGHDIKSTIKIGYSLDVNLVSVEHDVQIAAFLIDSLKKERTITELAEVELDYEGSSLDNLDDDEFINRSGEIVAVIRELADKQTKEINKLPKIAELAKNIEYPVIPVLAKMEYIGIELNTKQLAKMSERLTDQISDIEQSIYGYANKEFNINSPAQLADVLFNVLNLPVAGIKKGKTGLSTGMKELDKLRGSHPIIDLITNYRELTKLKNTYIDTLPKLVDENSRLHTTYNLTTAQTGRLSSLDPNLQNIPVRTEVGREIRKAFVAGPHNVLISADYSQFELRLAAFLADDKELIAEFNKDTDIHALIASQVYGRSPEDITKQMRRTAKAINFGILYGMSPHGLSVATGMSQIAAKSFIDKYYELRRPLIDYMNSIRVKAAKDGYVENLFGRRRYFPDINSGNFVLRQAAERAAINMPIQGTEADLMKMAMVAVDEKLRDSGANVLLQIHDSILVEVPETKAKKIEKVLRDTMESVYSLPVKLTVDTAIGQDWGEL